MSSFHFREANRKTFRRRISMVMMMCASLSIAGCQMTAKPDVPTPRDTSPAPRDQAHVPPSSDSAPIGRAAMESAPAEVSTSTNPFAELVAYSNWLRARTPEELRRLYAGVEARAKNPASAIDRLRLAILLSQMHAPFRNDVRARELADEVIRQDNSDIAMFAYTLRWDLQNRGNAQSECERALSQERRQRAALKQKLNELKAIEEQIHRRDVSKPATTP